MRKSIATVPLLVTLAVAGAASSGGLAAGTPSSPGACHMLEASSNGIAGMDRSEGGKNMVPLVVASFGTGCTP